MLLQIGMPELVILFLVIFIPLVILATGIAWVLPRLVRRSMKWWQKTQMEVQRELEEEEALRNSQR
jgi:hypothetical protein